MKRMSCWNELVVKEITSTDRGADGFLDSRRMKDCPVGIGMVDRDGASTGCRAHGFLRSQEMP